MMHVFLKFWKNSRWPPGVEKIGQKWPFLPICVRPASYLRDGWSDHSETLEYLKVALRHDARLFEILKKFKMAAWRWKNRSKMAFFANLATFHVISPLKLLQSTWKRYQVWSTCQGHYLNYLPKCLIQDGRPAAILNFRKWRVASNSSHRSFRVWLLTIIFWFIMKVDILSFMLIFSDFWYLDF